VKTARSIACGGYLGVHKVQMPTAREPPILQFQCASTTGADQHDDWDESELTMI